jgi:tetratricopeptide (TPR) repeat protein
MRFPHFVFVLIAGLSPWMVQVPGSQQDFDSRINQADNLYYQGQYADALAILTPLNDTLTNANRNPADQSKVKMLIGVTEIALGENDKARTHFRQFCAMNPSYVIDELKYPNKVVTVFKEAQQDCTKCVQICMRAEAATAAGDAKAIAESQSDSEFCACASRNFARDEAALAPGRQLMTQGKYIDAYRDFKKELDAVPNSAARREAVQTAQSKVDAQLEAAIAEWRQQFFARQWENAASTYDRIRALAGDSSRTAQTDAAQVTAKYQSTFEDLISSWNAACANSDRVSLNAIRDWAKALDPTMTIQPTAANRMAPCAAAPQSRGATK